MPAATRGARRGVRRDARDTLTKSHASDSVGRSNGWERAMRERSKDIARLILSVDVIGRARGGRGVGSDDAEFFGALRDESKEVVGARLDGDGGVGVGE